MSEIDEQGELMAVYTSLKEILQNDNTLRKKAEENFTRWFGNAQRLLLLLSRSIRLSSEDYIRRLASVLFKHFLAKSSVQNTWSSFPIKVREEIKSQLLASLTTETNLKVARQIAQAVAELATLIFTNKEDWPKLENTIMLFLSGENIYKELGFFVLEVLWGMNPEHYLDKMGAVCTILEDGLKSESVGVVYSAVSALCSLISVVDSGSTKELQKYAKNIVHAVCIANNSKDETNIARVLNSISEVAETEAAFFKKIFAELCDTMIKVASRKDYDNEKLRQIPLEILISILECIPGIIKKDKVLWNICLAIFGVMISVDEEIDESWLKPKEGYNTDEDFNPDDNITFGMSAYNRLLDTFDDEMFPIIEKILESSLTTTDWRCNHAALMSGSKIGEYILNPDKVKNVVHILTKHLTNTHPKVRYAALYTISTIAYDMAPDFQNSYAEILLEPLLLVVDDIVPRVQSQAYLALGNFLEHVNQDIAVRVAPSLLPKLVKAITGGISIVKESAMSCISSVAESCKEMFIPYYIELSQFVLACIKKIANKEYSKLRAQAIECLTIMSVSIGKANFLQYANAIICLLKELQDNEYSKGDQQRLCILGAWQRIVLCLGKDIGSYLPAIMPRILIIGKSDQSESSDNLASVISSIDEEKTNQFDVTTDEIEEKEVFLEVIAIFAVQLEELYAPYVEETAKIVLSILCFQVNSELKKSAVKVLPSLLKCIKQDREKLIMMGRAFLAEVMKALEREIKSELRSADVLSMKLMIDQMETFMQPQEAERFIRQIFEYFKDSNNRREILLTTKDQLFDDTEDIAENTEDCENQYEDNAEAEETYQKNLTYLLGSIVNTHKEASIKLVPEIIEIIIKPSIKGNENQQKNGLFAADDLVSFLSYEQLGIENWKFLVESIAGYVTSSSPTLRQASCYGIGCLAKNGHSAFKQIALNCLNLLSRSIGIKKKSKDDVLWQGARDAAVCAVGRVLQYQSDVIPFQDVWSTWLKYLPLTEDEDEAKEMHGFLIDCMTNNSEMAIGGQGENLRELIRIIVRVYDTKLVNEDSKRKVIIVIKKLSAHPQAAPMLNGIYNEVLSMEEKKVLEKIAAQTEFNLTNH